MSHWRYKSSEVLKNLREFTFKELQTQSKMFISLAKPTSLGRPGPCILNDSQVCKNFLGHSFNKSSHTPAANRSCLLLNMKTSMHGKRVTWDFFFKDTENTDKNLWRQKEKITGLQMAVGSLGNVALFFMGPHIKKEGKLYWVEIYVSKILPG